MLVWRISKKKYADSAFSGEGGIKAPGRWNHAGVRIVYTAQTLSLATLETWVHVAPPSPLSDHVSIWANIPNNLPIHCIDESSLPKDWARAFPPVMELREIAGEWIKSAATAVARVPSATTRGEFNYLLSPVHSDFASIGSGEPQPFTFDPRMWKTKQTPT